MLHFPVPSPSRPGRTIKIRTDTIANLVLQHIKHKTKMKSTKHRKSKTAQFKLSVVCRALSVPVCYSKHAKDGIFNGTRKKFKSLFT